MSTRSSGPLTNAGVNAMLNSAASTTNVPRTFDDLETAFAYRKWKRANMPEASHDEAVRQFCAETGATYERRKPDLVKASRELASAIGGRK